MKCYESLSQRFMEPVPSEWHLLRVLKDFSSVRGLNELRLCSEIVNDVLVLLWKFFVWIEGNILQVLITEKTQAYSVISDLWTKLVVNHHKIYPTLYYCQPLLLKENWLHLKPVWNIQTHYVGVTAVCGNPSLTAVLWVAELKYQPFSACLRSCQV